jgi:hypothetical protein
MYIHERKVKHELFKNCTAIVVPQSNVWDLEVIESATDPDII